MKTGSNGNKIEQVAIQCMVKILPSEAFVRSVSTATFWFGVSCLKGVRRKKIGFVKLNMLIVVDEVNGSISQSVSSKSQS